ncbi:MAG: hypothetical protein JXQ67_03945 [Campylobacterales bacterium]|nr:hypothetical protein [Campylobacterales bacterium]
MKRFLKTILTALLLIGVYVSIVDVNAHASSEHEVAVELVVECEQSKVSLVIDDFLHNSANYSYISASELPSSNINFIHFYLTKDIFRPPLAA